MGQLRLTEQGETIGNKYPDPETGQRHLESLISATIEATLLPHEGEVIEKYSVIAEKLSQYAFSEYRSLVHDDSDFTEFFRNVTPFTDIGRINIGSRPSSRSESITISDLRAIPWVFSWSQCRIFFPGWYGFGSAIKKYREEYGKTGDQDLIRILQKWPFFQSMFSNLRMIIAKVDLSIAEQYVKLSSDKIYTQRLYGSIKEEFKRTS